MHYVKPSSTTQLRRGLADDRPILEETSDDILAKYRSKKPQEAQDQADGAPLDAL